MRRWVHGKDRKALIALMKIYGDDTNSVLNGLHAISCRIAIGAGVAPDDFTRGIKYHWDFLAEAIPHFARSQEPQP